MQLWFASSWFAGMMSCRSRSPSYLRLMHKTWDCGSEDRKLSSSSLGKSTKIDEGSPLSRLGIWNDSHEVMINKQQWDHWGTARREFYNKLTCTCIPTPFAYIGRTSGRIKRMLASVGWCESPENLCNIQSPQLSIPQLLPRVWLRKPEFGSWWKSVMSSHLRASHKEIVAWWKVMESNNSFEKTPIWSLNSIGSTVES